MYRQLLLSDEAPAQGFLETPALKALAPVGSKNVLHTRSYHSVDCNTDHSLVCCKIRLQPKRFHCTKKQGNPRIDVSKMSQPKLMSQFVDSFERKFGAHSQKTLPQRSGTFSETPCTAQPSLPSGERPQGLTIGLTPSRLK